MSKPTPQEMSKPTPQEIADQQEAQAIAEAKAKADADAEAKAAADADADAEKANNKKGATVRILRTVPVEGVIYQADQLVKFSGPVLAGINPDAYDRKKPAVDFRKSEGAEVIEHGKPASDDSE